MIVHEKCYVRLRPSQYGIGVFAICDIPKGTNIFETDGNYEMIEVKQEDVEKLPEGIRKMYHDFCPLNNGIYECSKSFNILTPAWYLNNSDDPNCIMDDNYDVVSNVNIREGEELTIKYSVFSEIPPDEIV